MLGNLDFPHYIIFILKLKYKCILCNVYTLKLRDVIALSNIHSLNLIDINLSFC